MNDLGICGDVKTTKRWKVINVDRQWDFARKGHFGLYLHPVAFRHRFARLGARNLLKTQPLANFQPPPGRSGFVAIS